MSLIYKILPRAEWEAAVGRGVFAGSGIDLKDGYIHFSTAAQAGETLRLHFAGRTGLVMVGVEADDLGPALKWEPSRGGDLFPHLYAPLPTSRAVSVEAIADERP
jgi:uncharacterized protein (DUF952 family)